MNPGKTKSVFAWLLSIPLALAFLLAGLPKLLAVGGWIERFTHWGYPRWLLFLVGLVEVSGAILLSIPRFAVYGVWILIAVMLGAAYTHVVNGEGLAVIRPVIFFCFLIIVGWLRSVIGSNLGELRFRRLSIIKDKNAN